MTDKYALTDEGTRYIHYTDLLDLWGVGIEILQKQNTAFQSPADKKKLESLKTSVELLERHMEALADYRIKSYRLRDEVNNINSSIIKEGV